MSLPSIFRQYNIANHGPLSENTFKLVEKPLPRPKANEVLVKIHAVSLQYRDLVVSGSPFYSHVRLPENLVPCSDAAGEIVALGSDVKSWAVGQRVSANFALDHLDGDPTPVTSFTVLSAKLDGVLAEYRTFPAHSLVEIPKYMTYEDASTLPCAAVTAYNSLLGLKPLKGGDHVLVLGTGGVSIFALQIAVASGATVIATSSSDEKLAIVTKLGAKHVINYNKVKDWETEVMKITEGRGVDHVVEVGGAGTLGKSIASTRFGGCVHVIGIVSKAAPSSDEITRPLFHVNRATILRRIQVGSVAQFKDMNRLFSAHNIKPVIDKVFGFEDVLSAYKYLESQKHVGKIVIKVSKD